MIANEFSYWLNDGTPIGLRAIKKEDKNLLKEGFGLLSEHSRYLRFCHYIPSLSEAELTYLTDVDQVQHVAWGAYDKTQNYRSGIGIGRYVRINDSDRAELAITVLDDYQKRGLGTLLFSILYLLAGVHGINRLCLFLYAENASLLKKLIPMNQETFFEKGMFQTEIPVCNEIDILQDLKAKPNFIALLHDIKDLLIID